MEVYVSMKMPHLDGSGEAEVLGVYTTRVAAEARCFRELSGMQPLEVFSLPLDDEDLSTKLLMESAKNVHTVNCMRHMMTNMYAQCICSDKER